MKTVLHFKTGSSFCNTGSTWMVRNKTVIIYSKSGYAIATRKLYGICVRNLMEKYNQFLILHVWFKLIAATTESHPGHAQNSHVINHKLELR